MGGVYHSKESIKLIANNKKAYHDYFIDDKWELVLSCLVRKLSPSVWESAVLKRLL